MKRIFLTLLCITIYVAIANAQSDTIVLCQVKYLGCLVRNGESNSFATQIYIKDGKKHARKIHYNYDCASNVCMEDYIKKNFNNQKIIKEEWVLSYIEALYIEEYINEFKAKLNEQTILEREGEISTGNRLYLHEEKTFSCYVEKGINSEQLYTDFSDDCIMKLPSHIRDLDINGNTTFDIDGIILPIKKLCSIHIPYSRISNYNYDKDSDKLIINTDLPIILNGKKIRLKHKRKVLQTIKFDEINTLNILNEKRKELLIVNTKN